MRARWLLMPLLLALQACSGTTFGQRLADSFDAPSTPTASQQTPTEAAKDNDQALNTDQALNNPTTSDSEAEPDSQNQAKDVATEDSAEDGEEKGREVATQEVTQTAEPESTKKELTNVQATQKESAPFPSQPADPRPYRITIRLAAADPSAPAESVTNALRRAGIGFEVETIEKIPSLQAAKEGNDPSAGKP